MQIQKVTSLKGSLIGAIIAAMVTSLAMPSRSWALLAPVETRGASAAAGDRMEDIKAIQAALESKVLRQRLAEFNLTPEEINGRLGQLSDSQVHEAALQIRAMNPGGDAGGILVIVLLVLLIIYFFRRI